MDVDVGDIGDGSWLCWISVGGGVCLSAIESVDSDVERVRLNRASSSSCGDRGGVEKPPKNSGVDVSGAMAGEIRACLRTVDTGASKEKFSNIVRYWMID